MEFIILALCTLIGIAIMPLVIKLAVKFGFTDKPNERKVHTKIMPRMGGMGIYITFLIGLIAFYFFTDLFEVKKALFFSLLVGSFIIVIIGLLDDKFELSPKMKLLGQLIASLVVVVFGLKIENINIPFFEEPLYLGIFAVPIALFWIVGITNAINLVDGLDGLAGGISIISASSISVIAFLNGKETEGFLALLLVVSIFGFLLFNFHPAKIFMGDVGSLFLGFVLSVMTFQELKQITFVSLIIPVLLLAIPILDTTYAIIRRKINHKPIFSADKSHLHHQLIKKGYSQRKTVLLIYLIAITFSTLAIILPYVGNLISIVLVILFLAMFQVFARKIGLLQENN